MWRNFTVLKAMIDFIDLKCFKEFDCFRQLFDSFWFKEKGWIVYYSVYFSIYDIQNISMKYNIYGLLKAES